RLQSDLRAAGVATEVLSGQHGLCEVAAHPEVDTVMAAIVGAAGLQSAMAAVTAGKKILLANKEALVMSGALFMAAVREHGAQLLPVDSEHNAIFQCLPCNYADGLSPLGVRRIMLTASGGPFRNSSYAELEQVTPSQACAHPNWSMGQKISVDSASMMNKGLDRKSTRLNSSHVSISYAVFCLKKKKKTDERANHTTARIRHKQ